MGHRYDPQSQQASSTSVDIAAYGWGYGANVGTANVNGGYSPEILSGAGPGETYGSHVRAWNWSTGTALGKINFFAYSTNKWGVRVEGGDIDGDGYEEILTGPGPGAVFGPHVRGWDFDANQLVAINSVSFWTDPVSKYGVDIDGGALDMDGFDEILTGTGTDPSFSPAVFRLYNYDGTAISFIPNGQGSFPGQTHGVRVAAGNVDGLGVDDVIVAPGPGPGNDSTVEVFRIGEGVWNQYLSKEFFTGLAFGADVTSVSRVIEDKDAVIVGEGHDPSATSGVKGGKYGLDLLGNPTMYFIGGLDYEAFSASGYAYGANVAATDALTRE